MFVSNPFKVIDDILMTHVFNRVAWESEYRFSKDAVDIGTGIVWCTACILMASAVMLSDLFFHTTH
jgi:hypothetical protein